MSIVIIYDRRWVGNLGLPLASGISRDDYVEEIRDVARRFKKFIGEDLARELDRVFDEALKNEISKALNTDNLEQEIHSLVEKFWARMALPLIEFTQVILPPVDRSMLEEFLRLEERLGVALAKLIKRSRYEFDEDLIYGLSALIDRDKWILEKVSELGIEGFIKRVLERDPKGFMEFTAYTMYLTFAWVASTAALLGIIKNYKDENRDKLAQWCKGYAEEVEDYIDTLDILVKDEVYGELIELGIIER